LIITNPDEKILESFTVTEWPLKLRFCQIILTDQSFYASEGTWGIKNSIQCKYDQIIHIEYKDSIDYNYILLGILSLFFYFLIITIPLGIALIHIGLQKQLKIGLEFHGFKTIHGPSNVLLRVLNQVKTKIKENCRPIPRDQETQSLYAIQKQSTISNKYSDEVSKQDIISNDHQIIKQESKVYPPIIKEKMSSPPFYCQLCAIKHPAGTQRMQCDECGRSICIDSFTDMAKVGRTKCPLCDGKISAV